MSLISLPNKIQVAEGKTKNHGIITIEPCFPGYGITIGNSLRRVLLSSLTGAAVVGVKITGASHEFMALPHVKEDVLELVLNLKQLRLKIHSEEEVVKLELDVHGEKAVKAADITPNAEVEIVNPNLTLANITDMAGNLKAEIYAAKGMGYETVEARERKNQEIGFIEIDSIFSPVLNVGIKVENVRVGKMTNWDKLTLDVLTDGTITPQEAFDQSVFILIEQFSSLVKLAEPEAAEDEAEKDETASQPAKAILAEEPDGEALIAQEPKKKRGRPKKVSD